MLIYIVEYFRCRVDQSGHTRWDLKTGFAGGGAVFVPEVFRAVLAWLCSSAAVVSVWVGEAGLVGVDLAVAMV